MTFQKGKPRPKTAGRRKGTPNKITAELKEMILEAADRAGRDAKTGKGGTVEYLTAQAKENPQAFMSLLGKVLPKDLNVRIDPLDEMTDDQLRAYIVRSLGDLGPFLTLGSGEAGSEGEGATRH